MATNKKWYNDGNINKQFVPGTEEEGFIPGRIKKETTEETEIVEETPVELAEENKEETIIEPEAEPIVECKEIEVHDEKKLDIKSDVMNTILFWP